MHSARIAELLRPFLSATQNSCPSEERSDEASAVLSPTQLQLISTYIDLLLRWNARINLTAIRDPEEIVTRHFGESLFAAHHLFPEEARLASPGLGYHENAALQGRVRHTEETGALAPEVVTAADLGSGAGFPGIPIKLWAPHLALTLIESNHKKSAFLGEVVRSLTLMNVNIFPGRAEQLLPQLAVSGPAGNAPSGRTGINQQSRDRAGFDLVTLRAVERFASILPVAARLVSPSGRLALLIGTSQLVETQATLPALAWDPPLPIPQSQSRTLLIARKSAVAPSEK
jgi:16S rRNA (guanine527-N7)-methyltransferase